MLDNIFGFGVVRTRAVRFWLGPELRLFGGSMKALREGRATLSGKMLGAAAGPAVGVNFHLGNRTSLCLSGSFLYSYTRVESSFSYSSDYNDNGSGFLVDFRVGLLFRFGDRYGQE